jgi:hypothetical protein
MLRIYKLSQSIAWLVCGGRGKFRNSGVAKMTDKAHTAKILSRSNRWNLVSQKRIVVLVICLSIRTRLRRLWRKWCATFSHVHRRVCWEYESQYTDRYRLLGGLQSCGPRQGRRFFSVPSQRTPALELVLHAQSFTSTFPGFSQRKATGVWSGLLSWKQTVTSPCLVSWLGGGGLIKFRDNCTLLKMPSSGMWFL